MDPNTQACERASDIIMDFRFDLFQAEMEIFPYGIMLTTSTGAAFAQDPIAAPVPVKRRGMYFDHPNSELACYLLISGCQQNTLVLPPNLTIKIWVKPTQAP